MFDKFIILSLFCYTYVLYIKSYYIQYTIVDSSEIYPQVCLISLAVGSVEVAVHYLCEGVQPLYKRAANRGREVKAAFLFHRFLLTLIFNSFSKDLHFHVHFLPW